MEEAPRLQLELQLAFPSLITNDHHASHYTLHSKRAQGCEELERVYIDHV